MYEGRERRRFVRVEANLEVNYKFLSRSVPLGDKGNEVYKGRTADVGQGGILLVGEVPESAWLQGLLAHTIVIGINLHLPRNTVKSLTRVAWLEATEGDDNKFAMGLEFREISDEHKNYLSQYIISRHLP